MTSVIDELQPRVSMLHHIPVAAWSVMPHGTPDIVNQLYGVYRWHLNSCVPVHDSEGNILRFVGTSCDVHNWRQAQDELRNTQAEVAHMTRVMTMGELTASIAHEVNQPLGAITTSAAACKRWLAAKPPQMEKARQELERIIRDGNRASEVIKRIRTLMKRQPPRTDWLDINEAIFEVIAIVQYQLRLKQIVLETRLADDLPLVRGDKVQLQQVFLNLIVNAIDAMSTVDEPRELLIVSAADGPRAVAVEVRDSGIGFDAERAARVFEPFYTTKTEGLGIGLSVSRSIVEAHGGYLSADTNAPRGAVFRISLPVDESVAQTPAMGSASSGLESPRAATNLVGTPVAQRLARTAGSGAA